jgi:putative tricarboxylic transport membrane protein
MLLGFGALGWAMMRYDWPAAPLILGLVLGSIFENSLRQSLTLSHGNLDVFVTRPISAMLLAFAAIAVLAPLALRLFKPRALSF